MPDNQPTTAAYCRYSSDKQRDASIVDQLRNIEQYCDRMGWPQPVLYQDEATSGALLVRPGIDAMMTAAQRHAFDVLLVDDQSRLGRDMSETPRIIKQLKFAGIRVIGVSDGVDTDRDGYKADIGLRGIMGEMYLDDLAKKTHRGLTGQVLAGKSAGGKAYGYRSRPIDDGYTREIVEEEAQWIRYIYQQYAAGHSPRAIALDLNERGISSPRGGTWSQTAIYGDRKRGTGILANPMYIGRYIWNRSKFIKDPATGKQKRIERPESEWMIQEMPELRIVPQDLWDAVQRRQQRIHRQTSKLQASLHPNARSGRGPKFLFSGLLTCGQCGANYVMINANHYGCSAHKNRGDTVCTNHSTVRRDLVEQILLQTIKQDLASPERFEEFQKQVKALLTEAAPDKTQVRRRIRDAERELQNVQDAIRAGIITETTKSMLEGTERALEAARQELSAIENWQPSQILPRAREIYIRLVNQLENIHDVPAAREAIREITGEIRIVRKDGDLYAAMQGGISALHGKISLVAGAGFEPTTFGL